MSGPHDDRCAAHKSYACNCAIAALAPVRVEASAFLRHADKCWTCSHSPHGPCDVGWKIINDINNGLGLRASRVGTETLAGRTGESHER